MAKYTPGRITWSWLIKLYHLMSEYNILYSGFTVIMETIGVSQNGCKGFLLNVSKFW